MTAVTSTPTANAVPKADALGKLDSGWIDSLTELAKGTAAAPSLTFASPVGFLTANTTGFFFDNITDGAVPGLGVTVDGVQTAYFLPGTTGIKNALAVTGAALFASTIGVAGISSLQRIFVGTLVDDTVSKIQIDAGVGAFQAPPTGTAVSLSAADGAFARVVGTAFGTTGMVFSGRAAAGTRASPTASTADLPLFAITGFGHDGTSFPTSSNALYEMRAGTLWTGSNRETYHRWTATANGATSSAQIMRLDSTALKLQAGIDLQLSNAYVGTPQVPTGYITLRDSSGTVYKVPCNV